MHGEFSMKKFAFAAALVAVSGSAMAQTVTSPVNTLFAAVDFGDVGTKVATMGVAVIGIAMAMKAISIVKRAISKA